MIEVVSVQIPRQSAQTFVESQRYATEELPTAAPARYIWAAGAAMDNSYTSNYKQNSGLTF